MKSSKIFKNFFFYACLTSEVLVKFHFIRGHFGKWKAIFIYKSIIDENTLFFKFFIKWRS